MHTQFQRQFANWIKSTHYIANRDGIHHWEAVIKARVPKEWQVPVWVLAQDGACEVWGWVDKALGE
jgi:hypothetical protein